MKAATTTHPPKVPNLYEFPWSSTSHWKIIFQFAIDQLSFKPAVAGVNFELPRAV